MALMLTNRPEFHLLDAAAMHLGAVPFSIYNTSSPEQAEFLLRDSGARIGVVEPSFRDRMSTEHVIEVDLLDELEARRGLRLRRRLAGRRARRPADADLHLGHDRRPEGRPAHPQEHAASRWAPTTRCCTSRAAATSSPTCRWPTSPSATARTTSRCSSASPSPAARTRARSSATSPRSARRGSSACRGSSRSSRPRSSPSPASRIRPRCASSSGWTSSPRSTSAPPRAPPEVIEFFHSIGLPLGELWGMSETNAIGACNPPDAIKIGTVGPAVPGVEIRLADDGEVELRGDCVFAGYRGQEEMTRETFTDGRLAQDRRHRRARRGRLPHDRRPQEGADHQRRRQEHVAGEHREHDQDREPADRLRGRDRRPPPVQRRADRARPRRPSRASATGRSRTRVAEAIATANERLSKVEQIRRHKLLDTEWEPGGDELTPTMKLKRRPIAEKYAERHRRAVRALAAGRGAERAAELVELGLGEPGDPLGEERLRDRR